MCHFPHLLFLLVSAAPLASSKPVERLDISLANVRWQALPTEVKEVYVAPDGRTWYCYERWHSLSSPIPQQMLTVSALKRQIEREFREPSPQITFARPVLFEPGGRVWFNLVPAGPLMLVGYDGKTWIEYPILDRTNSVAGQCATRGGLLIGRGNRFAGGAAWFIMRHGILRFDGKDWSYTKMIEDVAWPGMPAGVVFTASLWLAVSPDGQTAVATEERGEAFWVFDRGKWGRREATAPQELDALVLPNGDAAWYFSRGGPLERLPLRNGGPPTPDRLKTLVDALKDESFQVRTDATQQLERMQPFTVRDLCRAKLIWT